MSYFYTSIEENRSTSEFLVRGYRDGKRYMRKVKYKPYLFVPTKEESRYRTLSGKPVKKLTFDTTKEARAFYREHEEISNFEIYGQEKFQYVYLYDEFPKDMLFDEDLIKVAAIDIETKTVSDNGVRGFPDIQKAENQITAITITTKQKTFAFGLKPYAPSDPKVRYFKCKDEASLLAAFIEIWESDEVDPDIVTGWNIEFFDIPYLVNRITRILGHNIAQMISPWRKLEEYTVTEKGREISAFKPVGIQVLDYINLYKKFTFKNHESYSLGFIAESELGETKVDYSEYDGLDDLYEKDFKKYMDYNIHDAHLVLHGLEDKLGFISMVLAFAYDAKVNYIDTLSTVKPWDVIIHNHLMDRCIVIPQNKHQRPEKIIVGGYVKDPEVGKHDWICSFDVNSLYPSLIRFCNIGPDTLMGHLEKLPDQESVNQNVVEVCNGKLNEDYQNYMKENDVCITSNMGVFSRSKLSFFSELMQIKYDLRKEYQAKLKEVKKKLVDDPNNKELLKLKSIYHNRQLSIKIQINAFYGSIANEYCRWFSIVMAEAITSTGQLTIQWVARSINNYLNNLLKTSNYSYVKYIDTDSCYVDMSGVVNKFFANKSLEETTNLLDLVCKEKMQDVINKSFKKLADYINAYDRDVLVMKRESICSSVVWTAKKKYVLAVTDEEGIKYFPPNIKVTGLEAVKSSTPGVSKKALKKALEIIVTSNENDLHDFVENFYNEFQTMPFMDISFPRGVSDIEKWVDPHTLWSKGTPIHVKGAIVFNNALERFRLTDKYQPVYNGDKIKFAYLLPNNPLNATVISIPGELPPELRLDSYIDRETQFEKTFIDALKQVTSVIGWEPRKINTLESFFI